MHIYSLKKATYKGGFLKLQQGRPGKNELHELRGVQFFKWFSAKFVLFSAKFGSLNMQIRNNFKNVIFIAYK